MMKIMMMIGKVIEMEWQSWMIGLNDGSRMIGFDYGMYDGMHNSLDNGHHHWLNNWDTMNYCGTLMGDSGWHMNHFGHMQRLMMM